MFYRPKEIKSNLTTYQDWRKANISIILDIFRRKFCEKDIEEIKTEKFTYEDPYEPARLKQMRKFKPSKNVDTMFFQLQGMCTKEGNPHPLYLIKYEIFKEVPMPPGRMSSLVKGCSLLWTARDLDAKLVLGEHNIGCH